MTENYIGLLQERAQGQGKQLPVYKPLLSRVATNPQVFRVECSFEGIVKVSKTVRLLEPLTNLVTY